MAGTESYVGVAPDGTGKKVATEEATRSDGTVVEQQQVLVADPATGRSMDAPPWEELLEYQRSILVELRVLTALIADETRASDRQCEELRQNFERELR
jgi:hypothetical protein